MDKSSKYNPKDLLHSWIKKGEIPSKLGKVLQSFYENYCEPIASIELANSNFLTYLELIKKELNDPYPFELYHKQIRKPFDYYLFGLDFLRPLVNKQSSSISGKERLREITEHLKQGHNVVFFANHQIEADPQAISLLLEEDFPKLAESMIFVAGERVITDPLAIPFSLGCNLLCIYSKRYIDHPPAKK
jgi:glycerol-3-phosphate O-acyltransferase